MQTIVIAAAKGGVGKTSLTAGLSTAAALDLPEIKVGIVDLDPQGSLTRWWNDRVESGPRHYHMPDVMLSTRIPALRAEGIDVLFVDCPPGFSAVLDDAILVADLVIVPSQPGAIDLAAIAATVDMAEGARVPFRTVLNRAVFRSRLAGEAVRVLRERRNFLWPPIYQRVEVASAMASGRTALETQPAGAAAREIASLWASVRGVLELPPRRRSVERAPPPVLMVARRSGS